MSQGVPERYETPKPDGQLVPALVETPDQNYAVDHVEPRSHALRAVNFEDDDTDSVAEIVDLPWHRVLSIEYYPAEKAREHAPGVDV